MTGVAVLLVFISAFAHAGWNLLAKRANTPELMNWWMAVSAAVIMLPATIVLIALDPPPLIGWAFIGGTVGLHIMYFFTLGRAYRYGDLSIVYPVARGLGLTLIPVIGVTVLGETVSTWAALGIALVFTGIVTVGVSSGGRKFGRVSWRSLVADRGVAFAVLTGLAIGVYSAVDKRGVAHVTPVVYMFFISGGGALGAFALIRGTYERPQFEAELRRHWKAIIAGGAMQFAAYALVLTALRVSQVSYVGPFRELAIGVGVILGAVVLKERVTRWRAAGAVSVAVGALVIALAP
jgi:drug/metabolite transporter (DMT)-like permease